MATFFLIILGIIFFIVAIIIGGLLAGKYYIKKVYNRFFGDNEKGTKNGYTQSKSRNNRSGNQESYQNENPPRQSGGKIFSADEGEYVDFEEIKE